MTRSNVPAMWVTATNLPTAASHPFYRRFESAAARARLRRLRRSAMCRLSVAFSFAHRHGRSVVRFSRMSKLIYITNASLDGYIEDKTGAFDWGNPDQVFDFITELMRPIGTHLLGRSEERRVGKEGRCRWSR